MNLVVNPAMLFLARESRGFSQTEFARKVGLSQATISRYEGGALEVATEHLEKIAGALEFPVTLFMLPEMIYGFGSSCGSYHRKRATLPLRKLRMIHARINIKRIQISRLLLGADIESTNKFDRMDLDQYETPERVASLVRASWQLPFGPINNLVRAIENAGGIVFSMPFGTSKIDAVSQYPPGQPPLFFLNSDSPPDRCRFTLAHEIGHIVMHETPTENLESEADRFASEFLMPARDIGPDLGRLTLEKAGALKPYWKVSMAAIIKRARTLDKLSEWQYKNLFTQLGVLGYRTKEPIQISPEIPSIPAQLVDVHLNEHGYSVHDLSNSLGYFENEFRSYYLPETIKEPSFKVFG
jgi:Zn-dependent peptidase ImmA (M78 family)/DNA-binding XRE family transcriptional regulator